MLIGDAAHATTPHLASGAGLAVEDAIVLAEEIERASSSSCEEALLASRSGELSGVGWLSRTLFAWGISNGVVGRRRSISS